METDPIHQLREHPRPPADLERRTLAAVRAAGGLRQPSGRRWLAAAAAAVIFIAGVGAGRMWTPTQTDVTGQPRYLLLLAGDTLPEVNLGDRSREYGEWARSVSRNGVYIRGAELAPMARLIGVAAESSLGRELATVGGYFIVEAGTEAEAVRLAESCPHVKYGGAIQVRKLL